MGTTLTNKVYNDLGYTVREIDAADPSTWPKWASKRLERRASMKSRRAAPKVERTKQSNKVPPVLRNGLMDAAKAIPEAIRKFPDKFGVDHSE